MSATSKPKKMVVADVERHGEKLIVPEQMTLDGAIDVLTRKKAAEEEVVGVHEVIDAFPWDGARSLERVLDRRLGAALTTKTPGFFGPTPPTTVAVETAHGKTENIIWGRFLIPGIAAGAEGRDYLETGYDFKDGRVVFLLGGQVRRKFLPVIKQLAEDIRQDLVVNSIYRGKAFRISFFDDDGDKKPVPDITFLDTTQVNLMELVYSDSVRAAIETNVFTPIRHAAKAAELGVPTKRGILLSGKYGTGKTLTAYATAKVAEDNGWSFVYITRADELPDAIRFAGNYSPAVIFAEDIDRTTAGGRTEELDEILNTIDGIDAKGARVMVVLTTNHLETINPAMLRPGRLDAVIEVTAPDEAAVVRLIRVYARDMMTEDTDVSHVARMLAGQIPAVVREVVERSKLYWLNRTGGEGPVELAEEDIQYAAETVLAQRKLTEKPEVVELSAVELFARGLGASLANVLGVPGWSPEGRADLVHNYATHDGASGMLAGSGLALDPKKLARVRRDAAEVAG